MTDLLHAAAPAHPLPTDRPPIVGWSRVRGEAVRVSVALVLGVAALVVSFGVAEESGVDTGTARFALLFLLDVGLGVTAAALLVARRAHPVAVGVTLGLLTGLSAMAVPAALMALGSVATRKRPAGVAAVVAAWLVSGIAGEMLWPDPQAAPWTGGDIVAGAVVVAAVLAAVVATGVSIGNRRELVAALQERARLLQAERAVDETRARDHERSRIAIEMHDVLGHQLSLVAMHAGVLHTRGDLTEQERTESTAVVHDRSRRALAELRDVLDVLRGPGDGDDLRPQPTLTDLGDLLVEGENVVLDIRVDVGQVPITVSRHAFRIVQECLTNARKHAFGCDVAVVLSGGPGDDLRLSIANSRPAGSPVGGLAGGHGLLGVDERARSVGGTSQVTSTPDQHRVEVALPWPAA